MSAAAFKTWRTRRGLSERGAAEALGMSRGALRECENSGGPLYVALACAAISAGIRPILKKPDVPDPPQEE